MYDEPEILDFEGVFDAIEYDWGFDPKNLIKDEKGNFVINKTYITPTHLTYKMWRNQIKPGVFEKIQRLYEMLQK